MFWIDYLPSVVILMWIIVGIVVGTLVYLKHKHAKKLSGVKIFAVLEIIGTIFMFFGYYMGAFSWESPQNAFCLMTFFCAFGAIVFS